MTAPATRVRQPRFADDLWYRADPAHLDTALLGYLSADLPPFNPNNLVGLVAPHAGHRFSGHVAGTAFASLATSHFDAVALIGPDHRGVAPGRVSTPAVDVWRTPLGDTPVAWEFLEILREKIQLAMLAVDDEHALEIELPFLQKTLGNFRLVPLLLGDQSRQTCEQLSTVLVEAVRQTSQQVLFVASSDLSHYFDDATARQLDEETLQFILNLDPRGLLAHVATGRMHGQPLACGAGAIATVMLAARSLGATKAHLLKYATSGDVHPDRSRVVGYAAIAFTK